MIVRRRDTRFVVDVCKNLEAKLWIFVKDLEPAWHCVTAIFFDKIPVGQQSLEIDADLFAAGRARVARKDVAGERLLRRAIGTFLPVGLIVHFMARASFSRSSSGSMACKLARVSSGSQGISAITFTSP